MPESAADLPDLLRSQLGGDHVLQETVELARGLANAPVAALTIADVDRLWYAAAAGTPRVSYSPEASFCAATIERDTIFVVPDATCHPTLCDSPYVTGTPHVRFFAGFPLRTAAGICYGTLCVIDHECREGLDDELRRHLELLTLITTERLETVHGIAQALDPRVVERHLVNQAGRLRAEIATSLRDTMRDATKLRLAIDARSQGIAQMLLLGEEAHRLVEGDEATSPALLDAMNLFRELSILASADDGDLLVAAVDVERGIAALSGAIDR